MTWQFQCLFAIFLLADANAAFWFGWEALAAGLVANVVVSSGYWWFVDRHNDGSVWGNVKMAAVPWLSFALYGLILSAGFAMMLHARLTGEEDQPDQS